MQVIVGLGNPGPEYKQTRHNAGFVAVEHVATEWGLPWRKWHDVARYAHGTRDDHEVYLLEPLTFMNRSGDAVGPFVRQHAMAPEDVLVICDEAQLPVGRLRLRRSGSAGGHHGLESVIAALGTTGVPRLRIGIGQQPLPKDLTDFVLGRWTPEERASITAKLPAIVQFCEAMVTKDTRAIANAVMRF